MARPHRPKRGRRRGWLGYLLFFFLGVFLVFLGYHYFSHLSGEKTLRPETPARKIPPEGNAARGRLPEPFPPGSKNKPKIAIVIDDLGIENHLSSELLQFDFPLTFSILPFTTYSRPLATEAPRRGKEVILHLPMEPHGYPKVNPGEGALLEEMSKKRLLRQLSKDIESVPNIRGVSNHMGSRLMEDPEKLKIILSELKRRGLFFLDSRTTPQTLGLQTARLIGLKATEKTLFIDHSLEEEEIKERLDRLTEVSLSTGIAIGIGHPHPATIASLREMIPKIRKKGIEIVSLSSVIQ